MTENTGLDLDAIEARVKAATEGPWERVMVERLGFFVQSSESLDTGDYPLAEVRDNHDAEFIAAARTDVPALVAEVRRLRVQVADAWAKGYARGVMDGDSFETPNPYREEVSHG